MQLDVKREERASIKKIMLVSPHGKFTITPEGSRERKLAVPSLGLAYLAAQLLKHGYEVELLDTLVEGFDNEFPFGNAILYGLDFAQVKERIQRSAPDLVAVSCLFSNRINEVMEICRIAKGLNPDVHVLLGGQHVSGMPETVLADEVDYILRGEADDAVIQLIETINRGGDLRQVDGIVLKTAEGVFVGSKTSYPDVKQLPRPAWHLFNLEKYWEIGMADYEIAVDDPKRFMVVVTSRGCPHDCYFCTSKLNSGRKYRQRDIEDVINEIKNYYDAYGVRRIYFWDDNFFISKARVKTLLLRLIDTFTDVQFEVPSGSEVNAIDEEIIQLMAAAGFKKLTLSVESANQDIQDQMVDKNVNLQRIPQVVQAIKDAGMIAGGSFMVGFPGETREQVDSTFERATQFGFDRISISIVNPLPGTGLWDVCVQENLLADDFDIAQIRWSQENIQLKDIPRGYLARRRREVWEDYMKQKIDIESYQAEAKKMYK